MGITYLRCSTREISPTDTNEQTQQPLQFFEDPLVLVEDPLVLVEDPLVLRLVERRHELINC